MIKMNDPNCEQDLQDLENNYQIAVYSLLLLLLIVILKRTRVKQNNVQSKLFRI